MNQLLEIMRNRRSVREYIGESISEDKLCQILQAGLLAPSGRARRPWEFVVVKEKDVLAKLAKARAHGASMLEEADCAVVVLADPELTDVWTEDCSIAMTQMHLMADYLGVGSCWIQGRLREAVDGSTTEHYVRELLQVPENYVLEAILSLGMPKDHRPPYELEGLLEEKVHWGTF